MTLPNAEPGFLSAWFSHQSPGDDLAAGIVAAGLFLLAGKGEAKIGLLLGETLFEGLEVFWAGLGLTRHCDSSPTNHLGSMAGSLNRQHHIRNPPPRP
jgi:hypothetical protein